MCRHGVKIVHALDKSITEVSHADFSDRGLRRTSPGTDQDIRASHDVTSRGSWLGWRGAWNDRNLLSRPLIASRHEPLLVTIAHPAGAVDHKSARLFHF